MPDDNIPCQTLFDMASVFFCFLFCVEHDIIVRLVTNHSPKQMANNRSLLKFIHIIIQATRI